MYTLQEAGGLVFPLHANNYDGQLILGPSNINTEFRQAELSFQGGAVEELQDVKVVGNAVSFTRVLALDYLQQFSGEGLPVLETDDAAQVTWILIGHFIELRCSNPAGLSEGLDPFDWTSSMPYLWSAGPSGATT
jgi:hypothetical protein